MTACVGGWSTKTWQSGTSGNPFGFGSHLPGLHALLGKGCRVPAVPEMDFTAPLHCLLKSLWVLGHKSQIGIELLDIHVVC